MNQDIRTRLNLTGQYRRENGESYLFFNRNSVESFERFYQRRNYIGRLIFNRLREMGYNLTDHRTLELFGNIYDSIGVNFDTSVIDDNTELMRRNHENNMVSEFDEYDIDIIDGVLDLESLEVLRGTEKNWTIRHRIPPSYYHNFVLLNPRNNYERRFMRELLNSHYPCIVGYFGDEADMDLNSHREEVNILENNTNGHLIQHIDVDNGYAYILTNRN